MFSWIYGCKGREQRLKSFLVFGVVILGNTGVFRFKGRELVLIVGVI